VRRRSEKYVIEGSKYAHWIGLYLSFHLNWVLGPFVHGRLQNLQTSHFCPCHNPFKQRAQNLTLKLLSKHCEQQTALSDVALNWIPWVSNLYNLTGQRCLSKQNM